MHKPLLMKRGDGSHIELAPMIAPYVYGGTLLGALSAARAEIEYVKPDALILHGSPSTLVHELQPSIERVKRLHPYARVWVGIGWDGTAPDWRDGKRSGDAVIAPLVRAADLCNRWGVEGIIHNAEAGWKDSPDDKVSAAQITDLAGKCARAVKAAAPRAVHFMSTYDHLALHGAIAPMMRGIMGEMAGVTGQAYVAVPGGAPRGALASRINSASRSQERAERAGYLLDDKVGDGEDYGDLDRVWTVQLYSTHTADIAAVAVRESHLFGWSLPSLTDGGRSDAAGLAALRFARTVRARGFTDIKAWQAAAGLKDDGIVGPLSLAAAGVPPFVDAR